MSFMPSILSGLKLPSPSCQSLGGSSLEGKELRSVSQYKVQKSSARLIARRSAERVDESDPNWHTLDTRGSRPRQQSAHVNCTSAHAVNLGESVSRK
jgi:hypothetical protein